MGFLTVISSSLSGLVLHRSGEKGWRPFIREAIQIGYPLARELEAVVCRGWPLPGACSRELRERIGKAVHQEGFEHMWAFRFAQALLPEKGILPYLRRPPGAWKNCQGQGQPW